ncbi:hypothetical protein JYT50_00885 [bacterium AH-315-A23]|nr:hypothetical protein [bacterium AH-315-A23]
MKTINILINKARLVLVTLLIVACSNTNSQTQVQEIESVNLEADKDWDAIKTASVMFSTKEAYEAYRKLPLLEIKQFDDDFDLRIMKLAEAFYLNYPNDERHDEARDIFISSNPLFISNAIPDNLKQVLSLIPRKEFKRFMRLVPLDNKIMEQWIQKGNAMVAEVLASDRPIEDKEFAEWELFGRDFMRSARYFILLPKEAKEQETDYWKLIDAYYWERLRLRLEAHIAKYADLPVLSIRTKAMFTATKPGYISRIILTSNKILVSIII